MLMFLCVCWMYLFSNTFAFNNFKVCQFCIYSLFYCPQVATKSTNAVFRYENNKPKAVKMKIEWVPMAIHNCTSKTKKLFAIS